MKIAIASGKGGTGKTTVATNLAWLASQNGLATAYLDCDTEAPNGHLFLRPVIEERREVVRMIPPYSEGKLAVEAVPGMRRTFAKLLLELTTAVPTEALPKTVRLNLNQIVHPPIEPASRHRQPTDAQPAPVCYLALRARGPKSNRV